MKVNKKKENEQVYDLNTFFLHLIKSSMNKKIPFTTQHILNIKLKATQSQFPAT